MQKNLFDWIISRTDLITEPTPGATLVEIAGDKRIIIENHRGVIGYGHCEIRVRVSYGILSISGTMLELTYMTKQQLVITGCIECVSLFKGAS